jgi:hypothetical protein
MPRLLLRSRRDRFWHMRVVPMSPLECPLPRSDRHCLSGRDGRRADMNLQTGLRPFRVNLRHLDMRAMRPVIRQLRTSRLYRCPCSDEESRRWRLLRSMQLRQRKLGRRRHAGSRKCDGTERRRRSVQAHIQRAALIVDRRRTVHVFKTTLGGRDDASPRARAVRF